MLSPSDFPNFPLCSYDLKKLISPYLPEFYKGKDWKFVNLLSDEVGVHLRQAKLLERHVILLLDCIAQNYPDEVKKREDWHFSIIQMNFVWYYVSDWMMALLLSHIQVKKSGLVLG